MRLPSRLFFVTRQRMVLLFFFLQLVGHVSNAPAETGSKTGQPAASTQKPSVVVDPKVVIVINAVKPATDVNEEFKTKANAAKTQAGTFITSHTTVFQTATRNEIESKSNLATAEDTLKTKTDALTPVPTQLMALKDAKVAVEVATGSRDSAVFKHSLDVIMKDKFSKALQLSGPLRDIEAVKVVTEATTVAQQLGKVAEAAGLLDTEAKAGRPVEAKALAVRVAALDAQVKVDAALKAAEAAFKTAELIRDEIKGASTSIGTLFTQAQAVKTDKDLVQIPTVPAGDLTQALVDDHVNRARIIREKEAATDNFNFAETAKRITSEALVYTGALFAKFDEMLTAGKVAKAKVDALVLAAKLAAPQPGDTAAVPTAGKTPITIELLKNETVCKPVCGKVDIWPLKKVNNDISEADLATFTKNFETTPYSFTDLKALALACNNEELAPCTKDNTTLYIVLGCVGGAILVALAILGIYYQRKSSKR